MIIPIMLYIFGMIIQQTMVLLYPPKKDGRFGIHIQRKAGPSQGRPFPG
jgi:hypothetical protein